MPRPRKSQQWLADTLAELVMASGLGYLAAAYTASRWMTKSTLAKPQHTPADIGLAFEQITCPTPDGHLLAGWIVSPPSPRGTVAMFHGVRNNREQLLGRIAWFHAAGYRCVAFDHRAHGESTGKRTTFGFHERNDVIAVLELIQIRWPHLPRAALGVSMGAAALCYAAEKARGFDAIILESVYHDIGSAFSTRMTTYPSYIQRLDHAILWVTERRLGLRKPQLTPAEYIGRLAPTPILLLTGCQDPHATPHDLERLRKRCQGPSECLFIPHAGHRDVFESGGGLYKQHVLDFVDRHLGCAAA